MGRVIDKIIDLFAQHIPIVFSIPDPVFTVGRIGHAQRILDAAGQHGHEGKAQFIKGPEICFLGRPGAIAHILKNLPIDFNRIDAMIIADLGVLDTVKKIIPDMEVHISTQASAVTSDFQYFLRLFFVSNSFFFSKISLCLMNSASVEHVISGVEFSINLFNANMR